MEIDDIAQTVVDALRRSTRSHDGHSAARRQHCHSLTVDHPVALPAIGQLLHSELVAFLEGLHLLDHPQPPPLLLPHQHREHTAPVVKDIGCTLKFSHFAGDVLQLETDDLGSWVEIEEIAGYATSLVRVEDQHFGVTGRLVVGGQGVNDRRVERLEESVDMDGEKNLFAITMAYEVDSVVHGLHLHYIVDF